MIHLLVQFKLKFIYFHVDYSYAESTFGSTEISIYLFLKKSLIQSICLFHYM